MTGIVGHAGRLPSGIPSGGREVATAIAFLPCGDALNIAGVPGRRGGFLA